MYWALNDKEPGAPFPVDEKDCQKYNDKGMGIFFTPNQHTGRRLRKNLTKINYWFCEIDGGNKLDQVAKLSSAPLRPTWVVESKNGYHCYWAAVDATEENWDLIVKTGIIPRMGGDPKASDPLRLLRYPGYNHHKQEPYMVKTVWSIGQIYTEQAMIDAFVPKKVDVRKAPTRAKGDGFWWKVNALNAGEVIIKLSGHSCMKGEKFRLKHQLNGNANIIRDDGYDTGCFVRPDGSLGGAAGPSVVHWLKWYGNSWEQIARVVEGMIDEKEE